MNVVANRHFFLYKEVAKFSAVCRSKGFRKMNDGQATPASSVQ